MLRSYLLLIVTVATLVVAAVPAQALDAGDSAPPFTAKTLDGRPINLAQLLSKKPVYLKFWATWCRYCVSELPHAQYIYDTYGDRIEVLAVNVGINDSLQNITELYQQHAVTVPTIFDSDGSITSNYKVIGTPHHVLIGRDGTIKHRSFLASDALDEAIKSEYQKAGEHL